MQTFRKAIRREAVLDFYNLFLALVLLVSPWLFALQNATARLDLWVSGALIAVISLGAIAAYANWEEWTNLLLGAWLVVSPGRRCHFSPPLSYGSATMRRIPTRCPRHSRARCDREGVVRGTFSVANP